MDTKYAFAFAIETVNMYGSLDAQFSIEESVACLNISQIKDSITQPIMFYEESSS
jgi:hypothetical protein